MAIRGLALDESGTPHEEAKARVEQGQAASGGVSFQGAASLGSKRAAVATRAPSASGSRRTVTPEGMNSEFWAAAAPASKTIGRWGYVERAAMAAARANAGLAPPSITSSATG